MKRRLFLGQAGLGLFSMMAHNLMACKRTKFKRKKLLILGGTVFLGPAIVKAAMRAGFDITLFNRGISNPKLFSDLRWINGDRTKGEAAYEELAREHWDYVIDVWPEKSYMVEDASKVLLNHCGHYTFISSIAVYDNFQTPGLNEVSKVFEPRKDKSRWEYFEEKVHAERLIRNRFPENHTILRPGPIKGWRDPELDLAYWLTRVKKGGKVLAPGNGNDPIQFIDVNDVGNFAITCIQQHHLGTFNVTGPIIKLVWKDFLAYCKSHFNPNADLVWVDEAFLRAKEVRSMSDMPLWAPLSEDPGFMQISNTKAISHGLDFTEIHKTFEDTIKWVGQASANKAEEPQLFTNAISFEKEKELLETFTKLNKLP